MALYINLIAMEKHKPYGLNKKGHKMKKVFILLIAMLLIGSSAFALNAPTLFTMTTPPNTYSPTSVIYVSFKMPANAAVWDSILVVSNADSTVEYAAIDTTGITWTANATNTVAITGLTPGTSYAWQIRVVDVDTTVTSNGDTLSTKKINVGAWEANATGAHDMGRQMRRWDSWFYWNPPLDNKVITLVGETDTDSTVVYNSWDYDNVTIVAYGDSVNFVARAYAGYCFGDTMKVELADTVAVTSAGTYHFAGGMNLPTSAHFYIKLEAQSGNDVSSGSTVKLFLNRSRFQGVR
jgi:hypothetical protein